MHLITAASLLFYALHKVVSHLPAKGWEFCTAGVIMLLVDLVEDYTNMLCGEGHRP